MSEIQALKTAVDQSNTLVKQMLDPETGLDAQIKALEAKAIGTADLKEQVEKMSADNAKAIDAINEATKAAVDRADALEAKMQEGGFAAAARNADPFANVTKTVSEGDALATIKSAASGVSNTLRNGLKLGSFDVKAVTALAASAGDAIVPTYETEVRGPGQQQITLLDVLPNSRTESPLIYWVEEVLGSRTNGVAIQSLDFTGTDQGTALGVSDFVFDQKSAETRTFGHTASIAIQILEDVAQLRGYLDNQMRYMVRYDLEDQILNGDGTGKNIDGLVNQATTYDVSQDAGTTSIQKLDVIRWAINQAALTFFPATAGIVHPSDITAMEQIKDGDNNYMFVNPASGNGLRPWGLPLVGTTQQTIDKFLVGAFNQVEVVTRKDVEVEVATENSDDFEKLLATMRAYGRFGLKVYQPGSLIEGDFSVAITGT